MGFLELLGLLELAAVLSSILGIPFELFAWFRSKDNRPQRKQAREEGKAPPSLEPWAIAFLAFFPIVAVGVGIIVALLLARL